jgi:hypothetical protein
MERINKSNFSVYPDLWPVICVVGEKWATSTIGFFDGSQAPGGNYIIQVASFHKNRVKLDPKKVIQCGKKI